MSDEVLMVPDWWFRQSSNNLGIAGVVFLLLAIGSVWTGKAPGRGGVTYRAKDPESFWFGVAVFFLFGALFIWFFLTHPP